MPANLLKAPGKMPVGGVFKGREVPLASPSPYQKKRSSKNDGVIYFIKVGKSLMCFLIIV
jgi:hypothetical protein